MLCPQMMENDRAEEVSAHVHRIYFCGDNSFSEPFHLPHTPPAAIKELV